MACRVECRQKHAVGELHEFIETGKNIIVASRQKLPAILDEIGKDSWGRKIAVVMEETHWS